MTSTSALDKIQPWLQLYYIEGLGCLRIAQMIKHFGSPDAVLEASYESLSSCLSKNIAKAIKASFNNTRLQDLIAKTYAWFHRSEHHYLLCPDDSRYPADLKELPDYPPILFVSGDINLLKTPKIAIVGSRKPTLQGKTCAERVSRELADMGLTVVSGMAVGIDAAAHYGALEKKKASIAIIGTGIDKTYPAGHQLLTKQLTTHGLLMSEFPLGTNPSPGNFPRRNRIISGLSLGVLVVEATEKSGSLITARLALEQGRDVFAIPGSITNPQSKGCHRLIREGAILVDEPQQILEELREPLSRWITPRQFDNKGASNQEVSGPQEERYTPIEEKIICPTQQAIINALGSDVWHIDELLLHLPITQEKLTTSLTLLEVNGFVTLTSGGYQRIQ